MSNNKVVKFFKKVEKELKQKGFMVLSAVVEEGWILCCKGEAEFHVEVDASSQQYEIVEV